MPNLSDVIDNYVAGDDLCIIREVTGIPAGNALTDAWFTVRDLEDFGGSTIIVQLTITTAQTSAGQITDDGAGDGIATVRFDLTGAQTRTIGIEGYPFDIQIKLDDARITTPVAGTIQAEAEVTQVTG
jgi:hypothetical protein